MAEPIGLREMVGRLRAELAGAMEDGEGTELRFRVEAIDLELQVAVAREGAGKGGIKFWIIDAGGEAKREHKATQTLRLRLSPHTDTERDLRISD